MIVVISCSGVAGLIFAYQKSNTNYLVNKKDNPKITTESPSTNSRDVVKKVDNSRISDKAKIKNAARNFFHDLKSSRLEDAEALLSLEGKLAYNEQALKSIKLPAKSVIKDEPEISNNIASVIIGDKKTNSFLKLTLIKYNNDWKVSKVEGYEANR